MLSSMMPKSLLVVVLKKLHAGAFSLAKMSRAPNLIFTVPPSFLSCDDPNVNFIENCGILRLGPNHFQQLSEIFQSLKDQIS